MNALARLRLISLSILIALACGGIVLRGADSKAPNKKAPTPKVEPKAAEKKFSDSPAAKDAKETKPDEARPPLRLNVDNKPINRDGYDRVSYAPVIKRTAASVVFVHSSRTIRGQDLAPFLNDPMLRRFFNLPGMPGDEAPPSGRGGRGGSGGSNGGSSRKGATPRLPDQTQQGLGSGVVITADGYILTNNHVVEGADELKVSIGESNKRYIAKVIGRDAFTDIAVLKIEATNLTPAVFGDSSQLQIGDVVLAIGNPFGVGQSVSRGIVSALSRGMGIGQIEDFIQTDAAINPGNSGGALLDTDGRVIGINTAILSRSGGFNGVGFAIPINLVRNVAEQIVNTGKVERGKLGVTPQDLDENLATHFGTETGVLITEVEPDSPAEKAGLMKMDVITKINNVEIRDSRHLLATVGQLAPNTEVVVEHLRDGKPQKVTIALALRTDQDAAPLLELPKDVGVLNGVTVGDITPQMREELSIPANVRGAIITDIEPDSPSAKQGLREGDVILSLENQAVRDAESAVRLSEEIKGPTVLVQVWREGRKPVMVIDESRLKTRE